MNENCNDKKSSLKKNFLYLGEQRGHKYDDKDIEDNKYCWDNFQNFFPADEQ